MMQDCLINLHVISVASTAVSCGWCRLVELAAHIAANPTSFARPTFIDPH